MSKHIVSLAVVLAVLGQAAPAASQQGWSGRLQEISEPDRPSTAPQVAVDSAGNGVAVWNRSGGGIVAAQHTADNDSWSIPALISDTSEFDQRPRVSMDDRGNAVVVWGQTIGAVTGVVRAARYDAQAGTWSAATTLEAAWMLGNQCIGSTLCIVVAPELAVDPEGNAMVIWGVGRFPGVLRTARYDAHTGLWSAPTDLAAGSWFDELNIAFDRRGRAIAAWVQNGFMYAARYTTSTATWTAPVELGPGNLSDMAVDGAGNVVFVWVRAGFGPSVQAMRFSVVTGILSAPVTLSVHGAEAGSAYPVVAVDPSGNGIALWVTETADHTWVETARYSIQGGSWEPSSLLSAYPAAGGASGPQIAIDGYGNATAVWEQRLGDHLIATSRYSTATGRWDAVRSLGVSGGSALEPHVAASATGSVSAVWRLQSSGQNSIQSTPWLATPAAPTISRLIVGSGALTVGFTAPRTAEATFVPTNYDYSTDAGATWVTRTPASVVSPLRVGGLVNGETYPIRIRARNAAGPGAPSAETVAAPAPAPDAPTGLMVLARQGQTLTLAWTAPSTGIPPTDYVVEGGLQPGEVLASISMAGLGSTFTLVAPAGAFYVRVHAVAGSAWSAASNEIRIFVDVPAPPSAPANLLGLVNGSGLALSWTNTFGGGAPTSLWLNVTGAITTSLPLPMGEAFTYAGVPPGTYTLSVRASNGDGTSAPSNAVTLTFPDRCTGVPGLPTNFEAWNIGSTIFASWSPPASGAAATGYAVQVSGAYVGSFTTTGRTLSGAAGPGTYALRVAATNPCGAGESTPTNTVVIP